MCGSPPGGRLASLEGTAESGKFSLRGSPGATVQDISGVCGDTVSDQGRAVHAVRGKGGLVTESSSDRLTRKAHFSGKCTVPMGGSYPVLGEAFSGCIPAPHPIKLCLMIFEGYILCHSSDLHIKITREAILGIIPGISGGPW